MRRFSSKDLLGDAAVIKIDEAFVVTYEYREFKTGIRGERTAPLNQFRAMYNSYALSV